MPFWRCYYHIIWTTKYRQAIITQEKELFIYSVIHRVAKDLSSYIFALNGTEDHIHVAVAIPPKVGIPQWVKRCKGASSSAVNQEFPSDDRFRWQSGYGVLSYGKAHLEFVIRYVEQQKVHHANNTVLLSMERTEE